MALQHLCLRDQYVIFSFICLNLDNERCVACPPRIGRYRNEIIDTVLKFIRASAHQYGEIPVPSSKLSVAISYMYNP
jgi:hypothetical protein